MCHAKRVVFCKFRTEMRHTGNLQFLFIVVVVLVVIKLNLIVRYEPSIVLSHENAIAFNRFAFMVAFYTG
jgi:hypothetical protein